MGTKTVDGFLVPSRLHTNGRVRNPGHHSSAKTHLITAVAAVGGRHGSNLPTILDKTLLPGGTAYCIEVVLQFFLPAGL